MKTRKTPHVLHLKSFGVLTEIRNASGLTATLLMDMPEIARFLEALEAHIQSLKQPSDAGLLKSLKDVQQRFTVAGREDLRIKADVVIAQHGVALKPIDPNQS